MPNISPCKNDIDEKKLDANEKAIELEAKKRIKGSGKKGGKPKGMSKDQWEQEIAKEVEKRPRFRPNITAGSTRRIRTGEGSLYITINKDENGLCEVFTTIGKAGGNAAAQSEAISRLISLALRSGIAPNAIIKQLKGISGPNPTWEDGRLILSTPDAIGKALDDYLNENPESRVAGATDEETEDNRRTPITMATTEEATKHNQEVTDFTFKNITTCPDCGSSVMHEAGCVTCPGCGFSKCE